MPAVPPATASLAVIVTVPFAPRATFSGVNGCRNPGVTVRRALADIRESAASRAVTTTCARSAVKYPGGVYSPAALIRPGPATESPPATDQATGAALALGSVAENRC